MPAEEQNCTPEGRDHYGERLHEGSEYAECGNRYGVDSDMAGCSTGRSIRGALDVCFHLFGNARQQRGQRARLFTHRHHLSKQGLQIARDGGQFCLVTCQHRSRVHLDGDPLAWTSDRAEPRPYVSGEWPGRTARRGWGPQARRSRRHNTEAGRLVP